VEPLGAGDGVAGVFGATGAGDWVAGCGVGGAGAILPSKTPRPIRTSATTKQADTMLTAKTDLSPPLDASRSVGGLRAMTISPILLVIPQPR
jgi:hypothetical protein